MRRRSRSGLALAGLILSLLSPGCGEGPGREPIDLADLRIDFDRSGWSTDFARHTVPLEEVYRGGPSRDGIPPVDRPRPVSQRAGDRFLSGRDPVIAVEV